MTTDTAIVTTTTNTALEVAHYQSADQNPARVYLASLAPGSVRTMAGVLDSIADLAAPGATLDTFPWGALRYQHTQAIRAKLARSARQDPLATKERLDRRVRKEIRDQLDHKARLAPSVQQARPDPQGRRAKPGSRDRREIQDRRGLKARRAPRARKVRQDPRDYKGKRESPGR